MIMAVVLPMLTRYSGFARAGKIVGGMLGITLILLKIGELAYGISQGYSWRHMLPLHLCDVAALTTATMLLSRNFLLYGISYFWALAGTLQALVTPALAVGFPDPDFLFFFASHGLVIVGVVFATVVFGLRPRPRSILHAFTATAMLVAVAAPVNWWLDANFLFLREKPPVASLMDYMGPWPWYILTLVPVTLLFFCFFYSPYWIADRLRSRKS